MTSTSRGRLGRIFRSQRRGGFTMVEILIVVSILVGLATLVLVYGQRMLISTKDRATRALIERLRLKIEQYYSITGRYPPDGIDFEVTNQEGTPVRGSAALYHALSSPIRVRQMVGGVPRLRRNDALMAFSEAELTLADPEYAGVREIVDAFDQSIHYDNNMDGPFRAQGGDVHYPPMDDDEHPPDPRTVKGEKEGGVEHPGRPQWPNYDIWSYGNRGHSVEQSPSPPIATWNLKR